MAHHSKRYRGVHDTVDRAKSYPIAEALELVKRNATAKFDESIDVAVNLGVDAKKSDQQVRGSVVLPKGTGKSKRVAVFAQGDKAKDAIAAGAEVVGFEDLAEKIKGGFMDFDVVIASPDAMRVVGGLGQILGPRGLMPNPKVGTVAQDVVQAVKNAKAGQVQYRTDKGGIIHCSIGRASFPVESLQENLVALVDALNKAKPASSKGVYCARSRWRARWARGCAWIRRRSLHKEIEGAHARRVSGILELWARPPARGRGCQRPLGSGEQREALDDAELDRPVDVGQGFLAERPATGTRRRRRPGTGMLDITPGFEVAVLVEPGTPMIAPVGAIECASR